jgi:hypothetical protein
MHKRASGPALSPALSFLALVAAVCTMECRAVQGTDFHYSVIVILTLYVFNLLKIINKN